MLKLLKITGFTKISYLFYTVLISLTVPPFPELSGKVFYLYKRTITGICFISGMIFFIMSSVRIFRLEVLIQGWHPI